MAAGMLVTRAASKASMGNELAKQLLFYPRAITLLAVMLAVMGLVPGMPVMPFFTLACVAGIISYNLRNAGAGPAAAAAKAKAAEAKPGAPGAPEKLESLLNLEAFQIELGYGLISLADTRKGGDLVERITGVRRNFAQEMGMMVPLIRLRDNLQLGANEYRFILKGNPIAKGSLMPGYWLAMNATNSRVDPQRHPHRRTRFSASGHLDYRMERKNAEVNGYTVVDASSVLVTHLSETVKRHAHEILSRQDVQGLLDNLKQTHPTVVNELIPAQLSVGHVQRILQNLLAEGISIRNLAGILEKVSDHAAQTKNPGRAFRTRPARAGAPAHQALPGREAIACKPSRWSRAWSSSLPRESGRRRPKSA